MSVSRTVSEIFSVKEWRDIETAGRGRSSSLEMAPFDRPYTSFYWSAIVYIALCGRLPFLRYLTFKNIVTMKSGLEFTEGHSNWYHSKDWVRFSIRLP